MSGLDIEGTAMMSVSSTPDDDVLDADPTSDADVPAVSPPRRHRLSRITVGRMLLGDSQRLRELVGPWYLALTLIVRLPGVIMPLSVLVYVAVASGSGWWGAMCAGSVYFGHALSTGVSALYAHWKHYQWGILIQTVFHVVAVLWLVQVLVDHSADPYSVWPWYLCVVVGAASPQLGIATRLRWSSILREHRSLSMTSVTMRHEAVMDALAMVLGALVAGLIAITVGSLVGVMASAGLLVLSTTCLLLHPTTALPTWGNKLWGHSRKQLNSAERRRRRARRFLRFLPMLGGGWLGLLWGSVQIGLVYFAASIDVVESIGAQFAALGLFSAILAVATAGSDVPKPWDLWIICAAAGVLASMLMSIPSGPIGMLLVLAVIGAASGPTLVSVFGIVPLISPRRLVVGLSAITHVLIQMGMALGLVLAAGAGSWGSYQAVALLPVLASALLLATAFLFLDLRARTPMDLPRSIHRIPRDV